MHRNTHRRSHKYDYPRRALNEYWIITFYKTLGEAPTAQPSRMLLLCVRMIAAAAAGAVVVVAIGRRRRCFNTDRL